MEKKHYILPGQRIKTSVPATSANIGPGYDSIGLALDLRDVVQVETFKGERRGELRFTLGGEEAEKLPRDETHLIIASMLWCWDYVKNHSGILIVPDGLHLTTFNRIPQSRGLGSSAAAIVAGVVCAVALLPADLKEEYSQRVFQIASVFEGHPDNVAAALSGGATISWRKLQKNALNGERLETDEPHEALFHRVKLEVHPCITPVIAVPDYQVSTARVRALLPQTVLHEHAARNSAKTALLVHALTVDPDFLYPATEDFLHQRYRAKAMVPTAEMVLNLRLKGFSAVVSGAGPTILVLAAGEEETDEIMAYVKKYKETDGLKWRFSLVAVDRRGAL